MCANEGRAIFHSPYCSVGIKMALAHWRMPKGAKELEKMEAVVP
jgi:hypothetical protein